MTETMLQVAQLRKALPHGAIRKIHKRLEKKGVDISYDMVARAINGDFFKEEVISEAAQYLLEYQAEQSQKEKKLSQKLNKVLPHQDNAQA